MEVAEFKRVGTQRAADAKERRGGGKVSEGAGTKGRCARERHLLECRKYGAAASPLNSHSNYN